MTKKKETPLQNKIQEAEEKAIIKKTKFEKSFDGELEPLEYDSKSIFPYIMGIDPFEGNNEVVINHIDRLKD